MACTLTNPLGCAGQLIGGGVTDVATSAWNSICESFATACASLLQAFAKAFVAIPPVDLGSPGIKTVYAISLGLAGVIAVLLLLGSVIRTAFTHDGSALAVGLTGIGKAAAAFLLTLTVAAAALTAADDVTTYIVTKSFGSTQALSAKIGGLIGFGAAANPATAVGGSASLLLLLAIAGILLTIVLWFELLLRNAAIAVLVATAPIAAAGQVSDATKGWWHKLVAATIQLIILKPVVALVFALGFSMTAQSGNIETLLAGMLVLLLAVLAWPAIARFFTFASVQAGGSAGLGMLLGFAAGRMSGSGGAPTGVPPEEFSQAAEARTMASGTPGAVPGAATRAAGAVPGALALAAAGVQAGQKAASALTGHMEQMAGHAGIGAAVPVRYATGSAAYRITSPASPPGGPAVPPSPAYPQETLTGLAREGEQPPAPLTPESGPATGQPGQQPPPPADADDR
jgi:hypothetical protein